MTIEVETDWWKTLFDGIYLQTDARSVCDEVLTQREVDLLCELIPLRPSHKILDLCGGQGRHSLELCRRGFSHCTVFDFSVVLLEEGIQNAKRSNLSVEFVRGDARDIPLPSAGFHHVLILGNSLGYSGDDGGDQDIVREAHRLLEKDGWLAIDVTDGGVVRRRFNPNAWHEIGEDLVVCRQRELRENRVCAREMVIDKRSGLVRDRTYGMRLYDGDTIQALVSDAGFDRVRLYRDFTAFLGDGDVGFMNHRMMVAARKTQ
jgi:D-alanine-D-alanine ligase